MEKEAITNFDHEQDCKRNERDEENLRVKQVASRGTIRLGDGCRG